MSLQKGKIWTQTHTEKRLYEGTQGKCCVNVEEQRYASISQGMPNTAGKPPTKELRRKKDFPIGFRGSKALPITLILDF